MSQPITSEIIFAAIGIDVAQPSQAQDLALCNALVSLYDRQTSDEQAEQGTKYENGIGFNGADSYFISNLAQQVITNKEKMANGSMPAHYNLLSPKQIAACRKVIRKYSRQLCEIAEEKRQAKIARQAAEKAQPVAVAEPPAELVYERLQAITESLPEEHRGFLGSLLAFAALTTERLCEVITSPVSAVAAFKAAGSAEPVAEPPVAVAEPVAAVAEEEEEEAGRFASLVSEEGGSAGRRPMVAEVITATDRDSALVEIGPGSFRFKNEKELARESGNRHGVMDSLTGIVNWERQALSNNPPADPSDPFSMIGAPVLQ